MRDKIEARQMLRTKHGIRTKFLNKCKIWIATAFIIADASPMLSPFYFDNINLCLVNTFSHFYVTSAILLRCLIYFYFKIEHFFSFFFLKWKYRRIFIVIVIFCLINRIFKKSSFLPQSNSLFESWNGKIRFPWKSVRNKNQRKFNQAGHDIELRAPNHFSQ